MYKVKKELMQNASALFYVKVSLTLLPIRREYNIFRYMLTLPIKIRYTI